jgi:uncharacterized protein YjbI with pentapeptide repeats
MANPEHLAILKQGVEQWNKWRKEHPEVEHPDLSTTDLREADLRSFDFSGTDLSRADLKLADIRSATLIGASLRSAKVIANLCGADLRGGDLKRADLSRSNLAGTDMTGANLSWANLTWADLSWATLNDADLSWADFNGVTLNDTDFRGSRLSGTVFARSDLSVAKGLETVVHLGPSTVGMDTIYKSGGKIPEVFLRGCGVPNEFIDLARSIGRNPIEYYSCFISYSTRDQEFAERLHADLQAKGVRCWFAPHDMHGGRKIHEQIDEAIRLHDRLLLILSEESMKSDWVRVEIAKARKREKEDKRVLFPVRLVTYEAMQSWEYIDSSGKDLAEEIRQYFIPDFSNWKDHDSYQAAFGRLVGDLKSG